MRFDDRGGDVDPLGQPQAPSPSRTACSVTPSSMLSIPRKHWRCDSAQLPCGRCMPHEQQAGHSTQRAVSQWLFTRSATSPKQNVASCAAVSAASEPWHAFLVLSA